MKIVFEFYGDPQLSFTGRPYLGGGTKKPEWHGAAVEGLICDGPSSLRPEGDALYIEGTLDSVRKVAEYLLEQLDMIETYTRAQFDEYIARIQKCAVCDMWFDPKHDEEHGDGHGNGCLQDGTVYMADRKIVTYGEPEDSIQVLEKGDKFFILDPCGEYEKREFEALEDPILRKECWYVRVKRDV